MRALVSMAICSVSALCAADAQQAHMLAERPCDCVLLVERHLELRPPEKTAFFVGVQPRRLHGGRIAVAPLQDFRQIAIYDQHGELRRVLEARKDLKQLVRRPHLIIQRDSATFLVFDAAARAFVVLDSTLHATQRVTTPGIVDRAVALSDGSLLVQSIVPTSTLFGLPLHRLSTDGQVLESWGGANEVIMTDDQVAHERLMARGPKDILWTSRLNRYALEQWTVDGKLLQRLFRDPLFFPPWPAHKRFREDRVRPFHTVRGIQVSGDTVFVLATIPREDWVGRPAPGLNDTEAIPPSMLDQYVESVYEVIDVRRKAVLLSQRLRGAHMGLLDPWHSYSLRRTREGIDVIDVWRVRVAKQP